MDQTITHHSRVIRRAYVGPGGKIVNCEDEGSMELSQVLYTMPAECDYAVVGFAGREYAIDLSTMDYTQNALILPKTYTIHDDVDAAIMAAVLRCDRPVGPKYRATGATGPTGHPGPAYTAPTGATGPTGHPGPAYTAPTGPRYRGATGATGPSGPRPSNPYGPGYSITGMKLP